MGIGEHHEQPVEQGGGGDQPEHPCRVRYAAVAHQDAEQRSRDGQHQPPAHDRQHAPRAGRGRAGRTEGAPGGGADPVPAGGQHQHEQRDRAAHPQDHARFAPAGPLRALRRRREGTPVCNLAAITVFDSSIAMVSGPHPARHRGDQAGLLLDRVEIDVADESVLGPGDADVDHHRPGLDPIGGDQVRNAGGDDEDVGPPGDLGQVMAEVMGGGDRRVGVEQHHRGRLAEQIRAADHHGLLALELHVVARQQFHHTPRGAGAESGIAPREPPPPRRR